MSKVTLWNLRHLYAREAYRSFSDVSAQMHGCLKSWEECETILRDFPQARVVLDVSVPDRDAALRMAERLANARGCADAGDRSTR